MRATRFCWLVAMLVGSNAWAGTVTFVPPTVRVNVGEGADLTFDVWVESPWGVLESIDMIIGSDTVPMDPEDWTYAPGTNPWFPPPNPTEQYIYPFGIGSIGGFAFPEISSPVLLGALAIDASGLPVGDHFIMVDGERDDGRSNVALGTTSDLLFGSTTITVIPEPGTIVLLALGGTGLACSRRRLCQCCASVREPLVSTDSRGASRRMRFAPKVQDWEPALVRSRQ